jgi:hypothetical protein
MKLDSKFMFIEQCVPCSDGQLDLLLSLHFRPVLIFFY